MNTSELMILEKHLRQIAFMDAYRLISSDEMNHKSNAEKIIFLSNLDFSTDDIARIVDTTVGTVRKEVSVHKSKQGIENGKKNSDKS